ncbi:unnamed protein product [Trifolium pratense]|uniref:Uncharacterized protein n=1 Tax=Trifolium pratense TaxID=57577 RepID=A0ACB0IBD4_TRIPR|nr:unnamed protein product [Trifolium pratense]
MAGRNDLAIANALNNIAQAFGNIQGNAEEERLDRFLKNDPPTFKGMYDPEGAQDWLQEIERIFRAMASTDAQRVTLATHMLKGEADRWWGNARQRMQAAGILITWSGFKGAFLEKYFPADVQSKKEMEFSGLSQGTMSVAEYAAKFEDLIRYCPHYNNVENERSKCVKFENGLRPEIKAGIGYQELRQFATLRKKKKEDPRRRFVVDRERNLRKKRQEKEREDPPDKNTYMRYWIEVEVRFETHKCKFLFWDRECSQLMGKNAAELRALMMEEGEFDPRKYPA